LINLRGDIVPVLDAGLLLGSPFPAEPRYVMVVEVGGSPVGLAASGRPRIVVLRPAPGAPDMHTVDGDPVVLVDAAALVKRAHAEAG
jgi:hypothetical protein